MRLNYANMSPVQGESQPEPVPEVAPRPTGLEWLAIGPEAWTAAYIAAQPGWMHPFLIWCLT